MHVHTAQVLIHMHSYDLNYVLSMFSRDEGDRKLFGVLEWST